MAVIGFNFRKIVAEKGDVSSGKVNIANNVSVKDIEEASVPVAIGKQKALKFNYEFTTKYEPNVGSIIIEGDVLFLDTESAVSKILKDWKKSKKVDKDVLAPILNTILTKCSIKGLIISQDLNLPSPMQLPSVTVK